MAILQLQIIKLQTITTNHANNHDNETAIITHLHPTASKGVASHGRLHLLISHASPPPRPSPDGLVPSQEVLEDSDLGGAPRRPAGGPLPGDPVRRNPYELVQRDLRPPRRLPSLEAQHGHDGNVLEPPDGALQGPRFPAGGVGESRDMG